MGRVTDVGTGARLLFASSAVGLLPLMRRVFALRDGAIIGFVPNASFAEPYGFANRMAAPWWCAHGLKVRCVDLNGRRARVAAMLRGCDLLYLCGGNSFHLMRCLRAAGVVPLIRDLVASGVPYVGESAGAVVAAPDIDYIAPMDVRREPAATLHAARRASSPTRGLTLTDVHVVPHVGGRMLGAAARDILRLHAGEPSYVPLRNDEALVVEDGRMCRVGTGSRIARLL
ncbi:Type 1 glutamine amidotransferase-like domain-containing protein [uncultured Bifidobacterium sp.]|uniref:Type 1 glutamine amidotransferase-like domain-containing protein n=1 Tax=uncultured Bifidobacterium sp. TaxID=165187 RepID=UPI0025952F82|nr:Type 1 glutamine amidotransferase-like domain-containing protein [uncultured Bifidobacterium sp.]